MIVCEKLQVSRDIQSAGGIFGSELGFGAVDADGKGSRSCHVAPVRAL